MQRTMSAPEQIWQPGPRFSLKGMGGGGGLAWGGDGPNCQANWLCETIPDYMRKGATLGSGKHCDTKQSCNTKYPICLNLFILGWTSLFKNKIKWKTVCLRLWWMAIGHNGSYMGVHGPQMPSHMRKTNQALKSTAGRKSALQAITSNLANTIFFHAPVQTGEQARRSDSGRSQQSRPECGRCSLYRTQWLQASLTFDNEVI